MKRLIIALSLLMAVTTSHADSYFTMGVNDTLRVSPGNDTVTVPVHAYLDGRASSWTINFVWPEGLEGVSVSEGPGMTVNYLDSQGQEQVYNVPIGTTVGMTDITSIIPVTGYYPYGGEYLPSGTALWLAGEYDEMFYLTFKKDKDFKYGTLVFDGMITGNYLWGEGVGNVLFHRPVEIVVSGIQGDVNGDGRVNIVDVTVLIEVLLNGGTVSGDADVDGNGTVSINDVATLINLLLSSDETSLAD